MHPLKRCRTLAGAGSAYRVLAGSSISNLSCPIDATDTQHGNGTFFETSLAEHVLCTHVNLP